MANRSFLSVKKLAGKAYARLKPWGVTATHIASVVTDRSEHTVNNRHVLYEAAKQKTTPEVEATENSESCESSGTLEDAVQCSDAADSPIQQPRSENQAVSGSPYTPKLPDQKRLRETIDTPEKRAFLFSARDDSSSSPDSNGVMTMDENMSERSFEHAQDVSFEVNSSMLSTLNLSGAATSPTPCIGMKQGLASEPEFAKFISKALGQMSSVIDSPESVGSNLQKRIAWKDDSTIPIWDILQPTFCIEVDRFALCTVRAHNCTREARSSVSNNKAVRCQNCENDRGNVASLYSRWTAPFEAPGKRAPIKSIVSDKEKADYEIRHARAQIKKLEKEKMKLTLQGRMKSHGEVVKEPQKAAAISRAIDQAVEDITVRDEYQGAEHEDERDFLQVYSRHVHKNQKYYKNGGKKSSGIRFDPLVLQYAFGILAKTSNKVYEEIAKVMLLPSLSYVSF